MPRLAVVADARHMVVDVLGALLFFASFMVAWSAIGAVQDRQTPPAE